MTKVAAIGNKTTSNRVSSQSAKKNLLLATTEFLKKPYTVMQCYYFPYDF